MKASDMVRSALASAGKTQRELASDYNISRSYVSRLEKKALEKLKTAMDGIDNP